jgi:hypothetical protein
MDRFKLTALRLAEPPAGIAQCRSLLLTQGVEGERDASTRALLPLPPGSLAALMPALEELRVLHTSRAAAADYSHYDLAAGLSGHPLLRELRLVVRRRADEQALGPWACWGAGRTPLRTMPHLRVLQLVGCWRLSLDDMLTDVAGCPELEQLEVYYDQEALEECEGHGRRDKELWERPLTGVGLLRLSGGACAGSLRRVVLETPGHCPSESTPHVGFRLVSVAALLAGCLRLQYLQLQAALDIATLARRIASAPDFEGTAVSAEAALCESLAMSEIQDALSRAEALVGGLLEERLYDLGVVAPARLRFSGYNHYESHEEMTMRVIGNVGGCEVNWSMGR